MDALGAVVLIATPLLGVAVVLTAVACAASLLRGRLRKARGHGIASGICTVLLAVVAATAGATIATMPLGWGG